MSILNVNQLQPVGGGNTITVSASDVNFSGNISIGSSFVGTASTATLATISQGLTGTPDITVNNIQSGVVTATTFIGDGSGITGVTASGSGINIKDSNSTVGVAATVDFGTNLNVSPASAGIVTVTVGDTDFEIADKIIHTGDTNTAIRFPADDTVSVETAGTERLRITSSGDLSISGNVSVGGTLTCDDVTNIDSVGVITARNGIHIPGGGNLVGIGTTNPLSRLHVSGTHNSHIRMTNTSDDAVDLIGDSNRTSVNSSILAIKGRWNGTDVAKIVFQAATDTTDKDDGNLIFHTKSSGSSIAERLRISSDGLVGIKTASPAAPLHVYDATNNTIARIESGDATCRLQLKDSAGEAYVVASGDNLILANTSSITERLRITSAGLIGVGNINPANYNSATNNLVISESGGDSGITLNAGSSNASYLAFNDTGNSTNSGWVGYMHSANSTVFGTDGSERMRIDSSGRLLVGTTTEITASNPSIQLVDTGTAILALGRNDSSISAGNALGTIEMYGNDGGSYQMCASIAAQADGTHANDDKPTRLVLSTTADGASSPTEKLRITSGGEIVSTNGTLRRDVSDSSFTISGDSASNTGANINLYGASHSSLASVFRVRTGSTERLRITSSGMFGFNHSSPQFGITIAQSANDIGRIGWEDGSNNKRASITCSSSTDALQFHVGTSDTERLRIGSSGQIGLAGANYGTSGQVIKSNGSSNAPTWQNQNAFVFYGEQNSAQNITTTTYTRLTNFNSRKVEEGDSSVAVFDESSGKLTIGANGAGLYYLEMGGGIDDIQNSDYVQIVIGKNGGSNSIGTRISSYGKAYNGTTANAIVNANTSCIVNLSANDVIRFYIFHNEGSTEPTEPNRCYCLGYKMN